MASQLWLLRHADAEPHGTRADAERRLTARGERQARLAGVALRRLHVSVDAILVSPKVRAQQTAELTSESWGEGQQARPQTHLPLAGGFDAAQALDALSAVGPEEHLMVVGHEPDLSGVVGELTGARVDLKKGGLAVVKLGGGGGELVVLLRPRELALIADVATADV
jgi:phosphohistidine phosphatase